MAALQPEALLAEQLSTWAHRLASSDGAAGAPPPARVGELAAQLAHHLQTAAAAWPELDLSLNDFVAHAADRVFPASTQSLSQVHFSDLYLAFGCGRGDANALGTFRALFEPDLHAALNQARQQSAAREDLRQTVYERLFVGSADTPPKILDYTGRGPLRAWFRVTVVRALLSELRKDKPIVPLSDDLFESPDTTTPELEHLKHAYRKEFEVAFHESVGALSAEERNVLRLYYAERLTIDQIAGALGLHRATAARRVQRARDTLLNDTRRRLRETLQLSEQELQSVLTLIQSQLHVSVARVL